MVISDSFTTSIFKQTFLRVFSKDAEGHLQMGFNATLDVQVSADVLLITQLFLILIPHLDDKGAENIWLDWTRCLRTEEVGLRR